MARLPKLRRSELERPRGRAAAAHRHLVRRYDAYLEVLRANSDVLALLGELQERVGVGLGRARFTTIVHRVSLRVRAMVRMLRELGGGGYDELLVTIERLQDELEQAMSEAPAPPVAAPVAAPLERLSEHPEGAFGGKAATLGRFAGRTGVRIPPGFAVAVSGFAEVLAHNRLEGGVRAAFDALDADEPEHLAATAERLQAELLAAELPPALAGPLREQVAAMVRRHGGDVRLAVRSSATGEDGLASFAGMYESILDVAPDEVEAAYRRVLASFFGASALLTRLRRGHGAFELGMGVLVLQMVDARASGVASSREPVGGDDGPALVEAVPGLGAGLMSGRRVPLRFTVDRSTLEVCHGPEGFGGGAVSRAEVAAAAALALEAESVLGGPADVEWALDRNGVLWLLQARPLTRTSGEDADEPAEPDAPLLLQGGACACPGAATGTVVRLRGREQALRLPRGAVAVAAEALPELALALSRAGALLAERGGITGHLATTARELGVPAVLSLPSCCSLEEGRTVTVDAVTGRVYDGELPELVRRRRRTAPETVAAPGGAWMRRVVDLVLPLHLTDPGAPDFAPAGCRSLHDVVRFVHERALSETVRLGDPAAGRGGTWYRLEEKVPFELRLVPLEGGIAAGVDGRSVRLGDVTSRPAVAFLEGVLDPAVQRTGPPPLELGGLASVMAHAAFDSAVGEPVWALVAEGYLQLSARIGYHFATVEALLGEGGRRGRVRFGFKGGASAQVRRARRAGFIAEVLDGLGFQVAHSGDFVSATFGDAEDPELCTALTGLGRLVVCANRLDMLLGEDRLASAWARAFLAGDYRTVLEARVDPVAEPTS